MKNIEKYQKLIAKGEVDALLLTSKHNRQYAAEYCIAEGVAVICRTQSYYFTDFRYIESAQKNLPGFAVKMVDTEHPYTKLINEAISDNTVKTIGFEDDTLTVEEYTTYNTKLNAVLQPYAAKINAPRASKEPWEIEYMKKAQEITDRTFDELLGVIHAGMTEQELCAELDTTVTQRSRYCMLYINGEYWGIYCLKDDITRQFYANLTGTAKEDVTMLPSPVAQNSAVYTEALGLWQDTTLTRREAYERFCEAMDMDGFIDWVLLEGYCANVDIKSNLRYFRTGDGPWQIAFYDLDWAFQTRSNCFFNLIGSEQTAQIAPTIRWLFGIDDFRERLLTRYAELTETTLSDEHVTEKIDEFRALLAPEIARERAHWGGSEKDWNEQVDALRANIADDYAAHTVRSLCSILGVGEEERMEYFGF